MTDAETGKVSEAMIRAGQVYLVMSGALEDTSLPLYDEFAEHFLKTVLDEGGEPYGPITHDMTDRATNFFFKYFQKEDVMSMADSFFVEGLLTYALSGVDINVLEEEESGTVVPFPVER